MTAQKNSPTMLSAFSRRKSTLLSKAVDPTPARLEVRTVAIGPEVVAGCEQLFAEYGRFRAWMYTEKTRILPPSALNADGTDFDEFDPYAIHLVAVETSQGDESEPDTEPAASRVVGTTRLIVDTDQVDNPYVELGLRCGLGRLPVEYAFPELCTEVDLRTDRNRCEVSRYTAYHGRPTQQRRISRELRAATVQHFTNLGGKKAYAVVEQGLVDLLRRDGVPLEKLTPGHFLESYQSVNFGVEIDLDTLADLRGWRASDLGPYEIGRELHLAVDR